MISVALQVWGAFFYLLNKICFSRAERSLGDKKRIWRIRAWTVYLIGLPAWLIVFIPERNWMAAAVEIGGAPSMMLGLVIAIRGIGKEPEWLNWIACGFAFFGIGLSLYDFGGITTFNQVLELGLISGFLFGTYLLAKQKPSGYLWFVLMNVSCAVLMWVQGYWLLTVQQIVSLGFVADAYLAQKRKSRMFDEFARNLQ